MDQVESYGYVLCGIMQYFLWVCDMSLHDTKQHLMS
jgi:hypothetical protein